MNSSFNPYLQFSGRAREAMEFYQSIFGGELVLSTFGESNVPGMPADGIMHAELRVDGRPMLFASDGMENGGGHTGFSLSLSGNDADELNGYFDKLSQDGTIDQPLESAPWGDKFGMLTDKLGIGWMVNISANRA
jgi:PhnB protein